MPGLDRIYDRVRSRRSNGCVTHGPLPDTLADALPNRRFWFDEDGRHVEFEFSSAVVVGEVVGATPGPAFAHEGDDELRRVDFDDPSAAERAIDVRVRVEELFGSHGPSEIPPGHEVSFRWGGLGRLDRPARNWYLATMAGMGRVVAVLDTRLDRDDAVFVPALQGALLGQVDELDRLMFPGLGEDEQAFMGSIRTLAALRDAASTHQVSSPWEGPLIN
jgi:hypothetical protein